MLQTVMNGRPQLVQAEKLVARFNSMKEGDVVSHQDIEVLLGETYRTRRYFSLVGRAKQLFSRIDGVVMVSEHGVGYRLTTGEGQMKHALGKARSGTKAIVKAVKICADVTDARLPDERQRKARDHFVLRNVYMRELDKVEQRQLTAAVNKTEPPPPMKV